MAGAGVDIHGAKWDRLVARTTERTARQAADAVAGRARRNVIESGRVRTGQMSEGFRVQALPAPGNDARFRVYNIAPHFIFQELGTRGSKARKGSALTIMPRSGGVIFRMSSGPITPGHFLRDAIWAVTLEDWVRGHA